SVDHLIKDCDYHAKKMAQPIQRNYAHRGNHKQPISAAVPRINVTRLRLAHPIVTKSKSPIRRHIICSLSLKTSNLPPRVTAAQALVGNPQYALKDKGVIDSRCSKHMKGNMSYLSDFDKLNGGYIAFGGNPKGGKISGKGKIKTGKLDFKDVYFLMELKFNLFSILQICDKKNSALFTDTEYLVLSSDFKLPNESQVLLRVPRENNMYNVNLQNIVPSGDLTCLFAKATLDESNLWHRRLAHINFKIINKLVEGNLVRGLPTKVFENDNIYVACKKGKQHQASCKTKPVSSVYQPLFRVYMDLFGVTFVKSPNKKSYCLVVIDDYSRFTLVFFLATKDETSPVLKAFITGLENQLSLKGIKREFSIPRTPQQNGIAERKNKTLIEAARTMLADSLLTIPVWAEAVNTAYPLGKFEGKVDEGFLVGYSVNSKAFRVFNSRNCIVQETLHVNFLENKPMLQEHDFDAKKLESKVILSPSNSAQSRKQDDKTMKEAKGKSLVESITGYRDLNEEFEDCSDNNNNEVNAAELEDITYSDDEDVVDAEADFNKLESSIPVSPIPTTRIYKDHPVSQIIGDLSSTTQTRSMTRVVKDQGYTQEEGIDYEEVFAPVARIEAIRLFLAYASFVGFMVYQMDVKSAFLYGTSEEEVKSASTPIDIEKPLLKDTDGEDVDVHSYRSMIGSLMYLTSSRPDIMFAVCVCVRFQVTPKASHLHAVKRIFRYLKGKPYLGLWYPKDLPFDLIAYSDSDYAGASLDIKSTTRGCQFLGCRLISWQCKKHTVIATSSIEAEYVAAAS
nr:hypothetical protein [Tanacetum cinerariifolium]